MITSETPEKEELRYLASLLQTKDKQESNTPTNSSSAYKPESVSDSNIIERMDYHGVTLLALQTGLLSKKVCEELHSRKAMMAANHTLKANALSKVFKRFNDAGLRQCLLFKGMALAYTHYPEPWLRPCTDSDCLITPNDRLKFDKAFTKLKFNKLFAIEGELVSYQSTYSRTLANKISLSVDLHWRINNRQILANTYDLLELSERATSITALDSSILAPSAVDSILLACIHRVGHHANDERLIWLYDIHLLANSLNDDEWEELCLLCEDKNIAAITLDALHTCNDILDTTIPSQSLSNLKELARRNEPSKVFIYRELSEWQIFKQDLKALKSPQQKLQLIQEHLFPPRQYMYEQMATDNLFKAHAKRLWRGLVRIIKKPN